MNVVGKALTILTLFGVSQTKAQTTTPSADSMSVPVDTSGWVDQQDRLIRSDTFTLPVNPGYGERILLATREAADSYTEKKSERLCYRYVKQGLFSALGLSLTGVSAYQAGNQLARSPYFQEKVVKPSELKTLPQGSVVVWNRSKRHPHGHISVADGQGREVSDRVRSQLSNYGTSVRVFVPFCQVAGQAGAQGGLSASEGATELR